MAQQAKDHETEDVVIYTHPIGLPPLGKVSHTEELQSPSRRI
jgi:hypothetical protein